MARPHSAKASAVLNCSGETPDSNCRSAVRRNVHADITTSPNRRWMPPVTSAARRIRFAVNRLQTFVGAGLLIIPDKPFRDEGRLVAAFAFDGGIPRHLDAIRDVLHRADGEASANA